jgi:hypothetical protein
LNFWGVGRIVEEREREEAKKKDIEKRSQEKKRKAL